MTATRSETVMAGQLTAPPAESFITLTDAAGNQHAVVRRASDGYINATALCQAGGKLFKKWNENQRSRHFLGALASMTGIPTAELTCYEDRGSSDRATWVHPRVAINIAQWISPAFDVQISGWIEDMQTAIAAQATVIEDLTRPPTVSEAEVQVTALDAAPNEDSFLTLTDTMSNQYVVVSRASDGYVNATTLCQAGGKLLKNWLANQRSRDFLSAFASAAGIPAADLTRYENRGSSDRATWVHPRVAINIAQWISPAFDVQVSGWVHELLVRGEVRLHHETPEVELMKQQLAMMQAALAEKDQQMVTIREEERKRAEAEAKVRWQRKQEVLIRIREKISRKGFIYMMKSPNREGIVKIGLTDSIDDRLSNFRTNDMAIYCHRSWAVDDMEVIEGAIHSFFEDTRANKSREWFYDYPRMEEDLDALIKVMVSMPRHDAVSSAREVLEALPSLPVVDDGPKTGIRRKGSRSRSPRSSRENAPLAIEAPPPAAPAAKQGKKSGYVPAMPVPWPEEYGPMPTLEEWKRLNKLIDEETAKGVGHKKGERLGKCLQLAGTHRDENGRIHINLNVSGGTANVHITG